MTLNDRDLVTTVKEWPSGVTTRIMSLFPGGTFHQRTEISPAQRDILDRLGIDPPPKIYQLTPAASR